MIKIFFKILLVLIFSFLGFIGYFSIVGFETKKFNNLLKSNLKKFDPQFDIRINQVRLSLDLLSLNINAKTLGPKIYSNNKSIELDHIKTRIPISSIIKKQISSSNLSISTKLIKVNDLISFGKTIKNSPELFMLGKMIDRGFLLMNINVNFDENGKIKKDFTINGTTKDAKIKLLNKNELNKINFDFNIKNGIANFDDIELSYGKLKLSSDNFNLKKKTKKFILTGDFKSNSSKLKKNEISNLIKLNSNIKLLEADFMSKNKVKFIFDDNFKIENYEINSLLSLEKLVFEDHPKWNYFFPKIQDSIILKNNQIDITINKDFFEINGSGKALSQNKYDDINYVIKKKNDNFIFDTKFIITDNPISINFLNFKSSDRVKSKLNIVGKYNKDQSFILSKIDLINDRNIVKINNLKLNKDYKISSIDSAEIDLIDKFGKKNELSINKNKSHYKIFGESFNASVFVNNLLTKSDKKAFNLFDKKLNFKVHVKKLIIDENEFINNFNGNLSIENNKVVKANLKGLFLNNQNISFSIIKKNGQKVTTFFSDRAEPFVKKFKFIKGFNGGSLDFYSVETGKTTNSQIKLYDFKLKEVPALTKILTLASLQGIADLLSGEGIRFDDFEMKFQNEKNLMTINEIYAIGPAISILMDGYIEKDKLISLRGTLVPATTINKAIGSIPILGEILVGKKMGEGVFGVSFKIKGPPKKTETTVNPIKTLTPRFITRTLEKIKKN